MNLRTITQEDAESLIDEFNLLDGVLLDKKQQKALRSKLNDVSNELVRGHELPEVNLEIVEVLITDCIKKFEIAKNTNVWEMENWFSIRLHNTLRITRKEASKNEIWFFLGLYFYNFVLWRWKYTSEQGKIENVLLGLPLAKFSRQIFSRCWWIAEATRIGELYNQQPQINGDFTNQLLDVNMFQIPGISAYINKFIISKNIKKNYRQTIRTFMYLSRELIVAQPMSSFVNETIDDKNYKAWLKKEINKDFFTKNKAIEKSGPKDSLFSKDSEKRVNNWFESVWNLTETYYENSKEVILSIVKENNEIDKEQLIEHVISNNLLPRTEQEDIKNIFNEIVKK